MITTKKLDMHKLAEATDLTWDSSDDERLFYDHDRIDVFVNLMSKTEYKKMLKDISDFQIEGDGYSVYAWNDVSGYDYWHECAEHGDSNYIQITASVTDVSKVNPEKLKDDIDKVFGHFCHYDNKDEYYSQRSRNEA